MNKGSTVSERLVAPAWLVLVAIVGVGWMIFGFRVGQRGLWSTHEGRAAQNAQMMLDTGDWLVPRLYCDEPDFEKPPLYYWLTAGCGWLNHGRVNTVAVRLPAVVAGIVGLILVHQFGRRLWSQEIGLLACLVLATTTRYAWLARVGRIDMPLCVCCLYILFEFWRTVGTSAAAMLPWRIYLALGVGLLLKGPVAILLTVPVMVAYWWLLSREEEASTSGWDHWRRLRLLPGLGLSLLLAAPWFMYVTWQSDGQFFREFFLYHNLDRALGTKESLKAEEGWYYLPRIFVDSLPWSLLIPGLARMLWRRGMITNSGRQNPELRPFLFLTLWFGWQFFFLSCVSFKRADYMLPIYPALSLLLAGWLGERFAGHQARLQTQSAPARARRFRLILATALALAAVTGGLLIWGSVEFLKKGVVHSLFERHFLARHFNQTDRFMLEHIERNLRLHWPVLAIGVAIAVGCVWLVHTGWHERRHRRLAAGLALPWMLCFFIQVHVFFPSMEPLRDMARFADNVRTYATPDHPVHYFGKYDSDLVFYAGRPAKAVSDWEELAQFAQQKPFYLVIPQSLLSNIEQDPRFANCVPIADNSEPIYGDHRHSRVLLSNDVGVAERPRRPVIEPSAATTD